MTKTEIKNLAEKIAKLETTIVRTKDKKELYSAMDEMMLLSESITSLEDMEAIDEEIQKILLSDS